MADFLTIRKRIVASFNMSFAGDAFKNDMPPFPSEYSFHLRDITRPRTFWNNAKAHLINFINDKQPLAVGLQEMNVTDDANNGGTAAIEAELNKGVYYMVSDKVSTNNAGISIIFDKTVAGEVNKSLIVDNFNQSNGQNPPGGRPLLMVHTANNYLFVNMHGAQNAGLGRFEEDFNNYILENNKKFLETNVNEFLKKYNIDPDHIFIMGDFNDRYDAIKSFTITNSSGSENTVTYQGESPKSCCHNWDSMGNERQSIEKDIRVAYNNALSINDKETSDYIRKIMENSNITIPTDTQGVSDNSSDKEQGILPADLNLKVLIPEVHGITVDRYINKGDKVFAYGEFGPLQIYTSVHNIGDNGVSKASDHELVYMEIPIAEVGGRKSRKSRKSRKFRKSRKSRKFRKSRKSRK